MADQPFGCGTRGAAGVGRFSERLSPLENAPGSYVFQR
jgi:hypothetical protein